LPVLGNPANYGKSIALTFAQYKYGWAVANFNPLARPGLTPETPTAVRCCYRRRRRPHDTAGDRRGHSLVIDNGWKEVADVAPRFVARFV
jgi:non-heme chloroperoxidase